MPFNTSLLFIQYLLDACAALDQYVQAHVMYSNDEGILVFHPYCTAVHYFQTSCLLDFLSWFPGDLIALATLGLPRSVQQWRFIALLRFNRLLQVNKVSHQHWFLYEGSLQML